MEYVIIGEAVKKNPNRYNKRTIKHKSYGIEYKKLNDFINDMQSVFIQACLFTQLVVY